jgi:CBS domain-containing protein
MIAKDIMTKNIVTIGLGHSIVHAAKIMLDNKVSGLPVIDDNEKLVGMLSEGDLMRRTELGVGLLDHESTENSNDDGSVAAYIRSHSWRVNDVMSPDVVTIAPDCPLDRIVELIECHRIKRLPVVKNDKMVGIVSRADLIRAIVSSPMEPVIRGDKAIQIAIMSRLVTDAGLEAFDISASVESGHVTLSGTVETQKQRDAARITAEGVRGCKSVTNEITLLAANRRGDG